MSSTSTINVKKMLDGNKLDLSMCDLTEMPVKQIASLKKATHIDLSRNRITELPDNLSELSHVQWLDLGGNKLEFLPDSIGKLTFLKHLDLQSNLLQDLPNGMQFLTSLRWLDVKDNPLNSKIYKVTGDCVEASGCASAAKKIVSYTRQRASDEQRALQMKLKAEREREAAQKAVEEERMREMAAQKKKDKESKKQQRKAAAAEAARHASGDHVSNGVHKTKGHKFDDNHNQQKRKTAPPRSCFGSCLRFLFKSFFLLTVTLAVAYYALHVCSQEKQPAYCKSLKQSLLWLNSTIPPQVKGYAEKLEVAWRKQVQPRARVLSDKAAPYVESAKKYVDSIDWKAVKRRVHWDCIKEKTAVVTDKIHYGVTYVIAESPKWIGNATHYGSLMVQNVKEQTPKLLDSVKMTGVWIYTSAVDVVENWPTYWEKLKMTWGSLK